jgi:hypothetical protein
MPSDDATTGITSLCNAQTGREMRAAALKADTAIKRAQRYETVTLSDLGSWPAVVEFETLPECLKTQVIEFYECRVKDAAEAQQFQELQDDKRDALANQLCDIHTIIEFTLRSQVLPEYVKNHTTGGEQTVHWEPLVPGSTTQLKRQLVLTRMENMQANSLVPGAKGQLLDFHDWRLDQDDAGMLHLLHRDLPGAPRNKKQEDDEEEEEDEDGTEAVDTATRSKSTRSIASAYVRAMHTAVIMLGREAHPRSVLCPLTSTEWKLLVHGYAIPETMLQGDKMTPRFSYAACGGVEREVTSEWEFLKHRTAAPFYRDLYIGDVYFAVRAMALAGQNKPGGNLATLHKECRRIALATRLSARAGFDNGLTVVHCMLQNSKDLFEPDAAAMLAIQAFRPGADVSSAFHGGQLLQTEVRRQLNLYHKELLAATRVPLGAVTNVV